MSASGVQDIADYLKKLGMSENARGFTENELKELCISKVICEQQRDAPGAAA